MRVIENPNLSDTDIAVNNFLRENCNVQYAVIYAGAYTEYNGQALEHDKWSFTLTRAGVKKSINFEYHTGIGHRIEKKNGWGQTEVCAVKPGPAGIIYSVLMNKSACNQSFADWCSECGYDEDSRKALATYEACQQEYNKLQSMFTAAEIQQLQVLLEDY